MPDSVYMRCFANRRPMRAQASGVRALLGVLVAAAALAAAAPAAAEVPIAGVQTHLLWSDKSSAEVERQLDDAKQAGAKMIRVDVGWSSLQESGPGDYSDWYLSNLDHVVDAAEERGIQLLLTFTWTPCWASSAPDSIKQDCQGEWWNRGVQYYAPEDPSDFGDAVAFLAGRYQGRVAAWEIWNEPNHPNYFVDDDRVSSYVSMVQASYAKIKAADPSTTVVGGSLAWSDYEFAERLYQAGIKGYFDALSIHPYAGDRSPLKKFGGSSPKTSFARGVPTVRKTMLKYDDHSPLWLTEFGWNTSKVRGQAPWANGVSKRKQARYLRLSFKKLRHWSYVPVAIWFGLENTGSNPMDGGMNYGLETASGKRKPAFTAFRTSAKMLAGYHRG